MPFIAMRAKQGVGRSESDILRFVVERGSASVTEVGDFLAETKGQTRNTAQSTLERLRKKGFLERIKSEGVYHYAPTKSGNNLLTDFVQDFVDSILGGSVTPLVAYLGERTEVNDEELEELKKLVKALEDQKK